MTTVSILAAATVVLALSTNSVVAAPTGATLKVVGHIAGPNGGWDYASFDPARRRLYVAHGDSVMMIEADTGKVTAAFAAGNHLHAVVPIPGADLIVTTNSGDDTARIISAKNGKLIASVPTVKDPDGAVFDPFTNRLVIAGGDSGAITLLDVKTAKASSPILVGGQLEYPAVDGRGRLYVNVENKGEIAAIDLKSRTVIAHFPLAGCLGPTGLVLVPGNRLISVCANGLAKILDAATGKPLASLAIGGRPDAVLYDEKRNIALVPSGLTGTLSVIALSGSEDNTVIETVQTQIGARTGAIDSKTGRVYLPTAQYVLPAPTGQRPTTKPGTFQVLVLDRR